MRKEIADCTLIIATYNWPKALELSLLSVMNQETLPGEVIIADDGSSQNTLDVVKKFEETFPVPLIHIWHEDKGFRLAEIRNKAFAAASKSYIIQIDGDIMLHRKFVQDHLRYARPNAFLQGSRVMLGKKSSERLLSSGSINVKVWRKDNKRQENALRILWLSEYLLERYRNRYPIYFSRGANMSFWRQDILDVNGYDEGFQGWGHEDNELALRLLNSGKQKLYLKFSAIAYHLYHPEDKTKKEDARNKALLDKSILNQLKKTDNGIKKFHSKHEQQ